MSDLIDRQAAIDALSDGALINYQVTGNNHGLVKAIDVIKGLPSAQPEKRTEKRTETHACDLISRQAAMDALSHCQTYLFDSRDDDKKISQETAKYAIEQLPSARPEQRCVNCGRTANNGGWYKDGRTRCPIEEHYALPKDGYCHLWEKRKVWEDDYVKRPEEGEK